ncbi:hypothetical protein F53441_657 [Fusarium austroafricanum]|uniref:BZIP domain-containing protein n=1 Tax=Fusarium austroafricanum TaxID=2364996 RepID=A0A8H4KVB0_9HYPO|nr:hypothetical protein F53441_657 [Fusarium austroafricanum]
MPTDAPATRQQAAGSPATDPQRLKKRESDRKAQRVLRERTKSRIAYLEDLVVKLSSRDDNHKTLSLTAQLSEVTEQRDKLVRFLDSTSASFIKQISEAKTWEGRTSSEEQPQAQPSVSGSVYGESPTLDASAVSAVLLPGLLEASSTGNELNLFTPDFAGALPGDTALDGDQICINQAFWTNQQAQLPPPATRSASHGHPVDDTIPAASVPEHKPPCDCTSSETRRLSDGSLVSRNTWQAGNQALKDLSLLSTSMLKLEDDASEDVPVRVVLYGWDHLAQSGRMTPLWKRIRRLDEICFSACGQTERLATIHMVHRYMRAYADPTSAKITSLPPWYIKSTSSHDVSGHPAVDYFAWPSFRHQFSRYPHRYCSNLFWHMFKEHLRIAWPYEFRDAYVLNVRLDSYGLSLLFNDTITNLSSWTMHADFFDHFPALIHDVPKFPQDILPATIHPLPLQSNSLGYLSRNRASLHHHGTSCSTHAQGANVDASKADADDQGWSYDTTVGDYNWCLDNL